MFSLVSRNDVLSRFEDEINQIFNTLTHQGTQNLTQRGYPKADIYIKGEDLILQALIPFVNKEDIEIEVKKLKEYAYYEIKISGRCSTSENIRNDAFLIRELKRGAFSRSFFIQEEYVEKAGIEPLAEFKDGILTLTFKEAYKQNKELEPRKIVVK